MSDTTETIQPDDLQAELERLQALLQQKDSELAKQSFLLNQKQSQLKKKDQQLKQQQEKLSQKETLLKDREQSLEEHQRKITRRDSTIQSLEQEVAYLNERLQVLLSKRYQAQSETLKSIQGQLFDEAELEQAIQEAQAELEQVQQQLSSGPSNDTSDTHKMSDNSPNVRQSWRSNGQRNHLENTLVGPYFLRMCVASPGICAIVSHLQRFPRRGSFPTLVELSHTSTPIRKYRPCWQPL